MNLNRSMAWMLSLLLLAFASFCFFNYILNDDVAIFSTSPTKSQITNRWHVADSSSYEEQDGETTFPKLNMFNFTFRTMKEVWQDLYQSLPNFPISYGTKKVFETSTCSNPPNLWDINFNNAHWQRYPTSNGTFYLYGAYLDIRTSTKHGPAIRVIGMLDRLNPTMKTFCQIWTNESSTPIITEILEYNFLWRPEWTMDNPYQPYMITCLLPDEINHQVPLSVSLVEEKCAKPTNNIRVVLNLPEPGKPKSAFAVCVKGISFPTMDLSIRMLEWLELLKVFGANKVFIYNLGVHPNVMKVMDYYTQNGFVKFTPHTLPGFLPTEPVMQYIFLKSNVIMQMLIEMIQYHDCLYRNMYLYEYIALIDIDELLVPLEHNNWSELVDMIKKTTKKTWTSIEFRNVFFLQEMLEFHQLQDPAGVKKILGHVPPYFHIMTNVYRHANFSQLGIGIKCLHDAEQILIIHNHFPIKCLGPEGCDIYVVGDDVGRLQHYRNDCQQTFGAECESAKNNSILDTGIWKYRDRVINSSLSVMKEIGFL